MGFSIGQSVEHASKKAKVVGVISAFMEPGKMPKGIDDIPQDYIDKGIDCTRWEKDSLLLEASSGLIRVPFSEVKQVAETKKRKK